MKNGSRFSFRQEIFRGNGILAAIVHVDEAWIDLQKRKLIALPDELNQKMDLIPKSVNYEVFLLNSTKP